MCEEKEKFEHLYRAIISTMEASKAREDSAEKATASMIQAASHLEVKTNKLIERVDQELTPSMVSLSKQVANNLIARFREADNYATRATNCYKSVSFWAPIKLSLITIIVGVSTLTGATMVLRNILPNQAEIQERFEDKKQLDLYISKNKVKLANCDGRRCVKINKDDFKNGNTYGSDDEVYVILDGQ